jgi:hypothetical protein
MAKIHISMPEIWGDYEKAVQSVFTEALRCLAATEHLPEEEKDLNLWLYWLARRVLSSMLINRQCRFNFTIGFDIKNQPRPSDNASSEHLEKRPDFTCMYKMVNDQIDYREDELHYSIECKRLDGRVFHNRYSESGILRFRVDHKYAAGCSSACMIGYVQNMDLNTVFSEVNDFSNKRSIPSLVKAASGWAEKSVTRLSQPPLKREFSPRKPIRLDHLWVDLRHCKFDVPSDSPPQSAAAPKTTRSIKTKGASTAVSKTSGKSRKSRR